MSTVFLSGASGFVGGHLVRESRAAGCTVKALSRRPEIDDLITALGATPVRTLLAETLRWMKQEGVLAR